MKTSPTQRTLAFLRAAGMTVAVVEKWNPHARIRQDLFGFIDVLAMKSDEQGLWGVQATSGTNHSSRVRKLLALPEARLWLRVGNRLSVVSWRKRGKAKARKLWEPRIEAITLGMFPEGDDDAEPRA